MANKPNRKRPSWADTHSKILDVTNFAYIQPKFFIPKKPFVTVHGTRFRKAQREGNLPFISYDPKTGIFVCHGFENKCDNDDCMHLLLRLQLVPMSRIYVKDNLKSRLLYYIPPEDVYFYIRKHYKSDFIPQGLHGTMKADEYEELRLFKNRKPNKK